MNYQLEFCGGLGDVFWRLYRRGTYNLLRDLQPGDHADVRLISHNPFAWELFTLHQNAAKISLAEHAYWHPSEDTTQRLQRNLPEINNDLCPEKDRFLVFHPTFSDREAMAPLAGKRYLVMASGAGLIEKVMSRGLFYKILSELTAQEWTVALCGRSYDRINEQGLNRIEPDVPPQDNIVNLIDRLTAPGTAHLIANSCGVITTHSACGMIGWLMEKPQLLFYPEHHEQWMDPVFPWGMGSRWHRTVAAKLSEPDPLAKLEVFLNRVPRSRHDFEAESERHSRAVTVGNFAVISKILGNRLIYTSPDDVTLTPHLAMSGFWESWISAAIENYLEPGMVAVDVGACFGYYTVLMQRTVGPTGAVHAFEPDPVSFGLLRRTQLVNGLSNVTLHNLALGDADGSCTLHSDRMLRANSTLFKQPSFEAVRVPIARMDSMLQNTHRLDFIKIDAEGAEEWIWRGFKALRERFKPTIALEFNPLRYASPDQFWSELEAYTLPHYINGEGIPVIAQKATVLASTQDVMLWLPSPLPKSERLPL